MITTSTGATAITATAPPRHLQLERAALRDDQLAFTTAGGFARALRDGCFLLELPADLDLSPGLILAREFYRGPDDGDPRTRGYRGFRDRADVYFDREHFQTEHILLDGPARARLFPPALVSLCEAMNDLALRVLRHVLTQIGIAPVRWREVTGGAVDNAGTHWFACSHYRPDRPLPGCAAHKDTGFVTMLFIDRDGLECEADGDWLSIDPAPGYFVVNFGGALEILTRRTATPVRAILHRVRRTMPGAADRYSFAAFANPPAAGMLYECDATGGANPLQPVAQFLAEFNQATWRDRHDGFGIK
jgi:hypothetical protein